MRSALELERAEEKLSTQMKLCLTAAEATRDRLVAAKGILMRHPGQCEVVVQLLIPGESETLIAVPGLTVRPNDGLRSDLNGLFGRVVTELVA